MPRLTSYLKKEICVYMNYGEPHGGIVLERMVYGTQSMRPTHGAVVDISPVIPTYSVRCHHWEITLDGDCDATYVRLLRVMSTSGVYSG
ncbi:Uncharacterized protein TCM_027785 [Theobroma cacao]|uniref:Uncharacterized protein n=1 Tax=Theobroma cacao TaxID=3641 RepID=A0A061GAX9_THECC|nr:Uncharacterized protein TCM_027785 [Theobroma cacao]